MANFRQVHVRIWSKPWFEEADPDAKILFLYLITNPHRNESCLYQITKKKIGDETGLTPKRVDEALAFLSSHGRIAYDETTATMWVVNAIEYQSINPKCRTAIIRDVENCPSTALASAFVSRYGNLLNLEENAAEVMGIDTHSNGYANPPIGIGIGIGIENTGSTESSGSTEGGRGPEEATPPPTPPDASVVVPDDETFRTAMAIYNAYPLPSNQQWALRAIRDAARRLTASGEMSEMQAMTYLLERTKAYAAIVKQAPIEQRSYAPAPARWFEEERFFDADETWRQRFRVGAVGNGAAAIGDYHAYGLFTRAESQNEFRRIKASGVDDPKFDTYDLPEGVALDGDTFLVRYRNSKLPPVPETLARLRPQKRAQGRFSPAPAPTTHPAAKNAVTELTDACNGTPNGSGAPS